MQPYVLVITDDAEEQLAIVEGLEDAGYLADSVTTAEKALDICLKTRVDLVFSSHAHLECSGVRTYQAMQNRCPELVFILAAPQGHIPHLDLPGLNVGPIVPSPFTIRELTTVVRRTTSPWQFFKRHLGERLRVLQGLEAKAK